MTTGGPTGPAENRETLGRSTQEGTTKIDQVRKVGKYCKELTQNPGIQEKIKEYHNGRITKSQIEELFKRDLSGKSADFKRQIGIGDGDDAFETFLTNTKCFENQFMYEITHNTKIKERAKEEMLDGCMETLRDEYNITSSQEATVRTYLSQNETAQGRNIFLESSKKRRKVLKKALPSPLTEKTLDDIDFNDLHSKIANLSPTDPNSRRIQAIWSTILGGIRVQEGEDVTAAFRRIQEEGGEGDLTADYEAFFSCPDSLISRANKDRIRNFLIRQYTPTISLANLQEIDQEAAKKLLSQYQVDTHTETSPDAGWESAIKAQRDEFARQARGLSLVTHAISTKNLDIKTQLRILGCLSSARRLNQKNSFARGHVGESNIPGIDYESAFEITNGFKPDEVMTDDGLVAKLEEAQGNKVKNLDKFAPGAVMRWKNKGADGKEMIGYYIIEHTLGNVLGDEGESGDIKLRFLGNNQNGGRLSRAGIPQTKTGPQFFEYLDRCADGSEIDFISDGGTLESEELKKTLAADGVSFYTDTEAKEELKSRYGSVDIQSEEALNAEIDSLLYGKGNPLEAENPDNRKLCSGMVFALQKNDTLDTFEIEDIIEPSDGHPGYVKIWDGWGNSEDSRRELSFGEFVVQLKHFKSSYSGVYRVPFGKSGERMGHEQFNKLLKSKPHSFEGKDTKNAKIAIEDGKFGEYDTNGIFHEKTIIKVGDDRDLHISKIEGNIVTVSQGTFKQTDFDKDKGVFKQKPEFHGSHPYQIPLQLLWSYLQTNSYTELTKENLDPQYKKQKESDGSVGWLNIFKHAHSLGVLLHGDLWKAPFKAWEEGHHKEHAFHGKLTSALAVEKLQSQGGPIGSILNWSEWPSLMVADSNSSFQSYLDDLVNKIDGMGSFHRTRLIKKWSQEHFPSPKFMAAMLASMKIFSQLYPYDDGEKDVRNTKEGGKEWFWYNSIMHTGAVPVPEGWPKHMPPHKKDDKWPTENGQELTEIAACYKVFNSFKHPILKNLGRRFQKYMNNGHDEQLEGGKGNLDQRVTMDEKLSWMMRAVLGDKITEAFGVGTEKWLMEGYPTEISTMPYAAMLFGSREQQMVPKTQEHILKDLFQGGSHVPMFAFAQSKNLGDIFRTTGVAFAYTISGSVGKELEDLVAYAAHHRIHKDSEVDGQQWQKKFEKFWRKNGAQLMHKMTGMRDPMLNLMVNDSETFETLVSSASPEKKKQYEKLRENKGVISAYYNRLTQTYDSPQHCGMDRNKGFYSGDHFRFRKNFNAGYPIFWMNWPDYLEQLDKGFLQGSAEKTGDGLFNEVRGFIDAMPEMAKKMVEDMGITQEPERTDSIHRVCEKLYTTNVKDGIRKSMPKVGASPDAAYCSVSAMLLGMAPLKKFTFGGSDPAEQAKYAGYHERMKKIIETAEKMEKTDFPASIAYRTKQWKKWQVIVNDRTELEDIDATPDSAEQVVPGNRNSMIPQVTSQTLSETEAILRNTHHKKRQRGAMVRDDESLSQGGQGSQQGQDDDDESPPSPLNRP